MVIVGSCGTVGNQVIGTWVCTNVGNLMGALFSRIVGEWMCTRLGGTIGNLLSPRLDKRMGIRAMELDKRIVPIESHKTIVLVVVTHSFGLMFNQLSSVLHFAL